MEYPWLLQVFDRDPFNRIYRDFPSMKLLGILLVKVPVARSLVGDFISVNQRILSFVTSALEHN